jgi:hypothetical protein
MDNPPVTRATVRALADLAGLPLSDARAADLAPQLAIWIGLAEELNQKMSRAQHRTLIPLVVFSSNPGSAP